MTPLEQQMLKEVYEYVQQRKIQQISYPLDDASRNAMDLNSLVFTGTGTASTQNINITTTPQSIVVPAQPSGTIKVRKDNTEYELLVK